MMQSDGRRAHARARILIVDDSPFFRNLLAPLLAVAGYRVTTVESADRALDLCEAGEDFDVIVSDIEMPGMNGFQFAEAVRSSARWQNTPLVALSSHASAKDRTICAHGQNGGAPPPSQQRPQTTRAPRWPA